MTPEEDQAWREMVNLGQELDADLCWAWWNPGDGSSYHRCILSGTHQGRLHECCCSATTADAVKATPQRGEPPLSVRERLDRMAREGQAAGLYEATEGKPPRTR